MRVLSAFSWGRVSFSIQAGDAQKFFASCASNGIALQNIRPAGIGYTAQIKADKYHCLHALARRQRCVLRIIKKRGILFRLQRYRKRYGILAGAALAVCMLLLAQNMIWYIDFSRCTPEQAAYLRAELYRYGVSEGAWKNTEHLRYARRKIAASSPEYAWLGLNFTHGRLTVEKIETEPKPPISGKDINDIIATQDGLIQKIELENGFVVKNIGQSVAMGEVLVSGAKQNKSGTYSYVHAQAEVYAQVEKTYTIFQPYQYTAQVPSLDCSRQYALQAGGFSVPSVFLKKAEDAALCHSFVRPLRIWGLSLPVTVLEVCERDAETVDISLTAVQAQRLAQAKLYMAIQNDLGPYELLSLEQKITRSKDGVKVDFAVKAVCQIGSSAPYSPNANAENGIIEPPKPETA